MGPPLGQVPSTARQGVPPACMPTAYSYRLLPDLVHVQWGYRGESPGERRQGQ